MSLSSGHDAEDVLALFLRQLPQVKVEPCCKTGSSGFCRIRGFFTCLRLVQSGALQGLSCAGIFMIWCLSAVFFRAENVEDAVNIYSSAFAPAAGAREADHMGGFGRLVVFSVLAHVVQYYRVTLAVYLMRYRAWLLPLMAVVLFYMIARIERLGAQFMYFQF